MRLRWPDRHTRYRRVLSAYIDGELGQRDVRAVEGHLALCESCARETDDLRATARALRSLPEMEAPRSFVLTPAQAARPVPRKAGGARSVAMAMRMASAGLAAALALVLAGDAADLGGGGGSEPTEADLSTAAKSADMPGVEALSPTTPQPALEDAGAPPATEATGAPDAVHGMEPEPTASPDGQAYDAEATLAPGTQQDERTGEGDASTSQGDDTTMLSEDQSGGGGLSGLEIAEITLAVLLGTAVAGSVAFSVAGRKRI